MENNRNGREDENLNIPCAGGIYRKSQLGQFSNGSIDIVGHGEESDIAEDVTV